MTIQRYLLLSMIVWLPLKAAYEPRKYTEFIKETLQELNSLKQINDDKIGSLQKNRDYVLKKEHEQRRSPLFKKQLVPIIEGNDTTLSGLLEENRLIQGQIKQLNDALAPAQVLLITDQTSENQALKRANMQISVASLQRNTARAQSAQAFFDRQITSVEPSASQDLRSLQKNWDKKKSILDAKLTKEEAALKSLA